MLLPEFSEEHMPTPSVANRLLVSLAVRILSSSDRTSRLCRSPHKQTLSEPNTPIDHVYFVQEGMVSLVQPLENGAMIEVGMIGNEGFLGVPVCSVPIPPPLKRWFRFLVLPYGCPQAPSAKKRAGAPP